MSIDECFWVCVCAQVVKLYGKSSCVFEERVHSFIRNLKGSVNPKKLRTATLETSLCGITREAYRERILFFPVLTVMTTTHLRETECSL